MEPKKQNSGLLLGAHRVEDPTDKVSTPLDLEGIEEFFSEAVNIVKGPVYVLADHDDHIQGKTEHEVFVLNLLKTLCEETRAVEIRFSEKK